MELQLTPPVCLLLVAFVHSGCQRHAGEASPETSRRPESSGAAASPSADVAPPLIDAGLAMDQTADEWDQKFDDDTQIDASQKAQDEKAVLDALRPLANAVLGESPVCRAKYCRVMLVAPSEAHARKAIKQLIGPGEPALWNGAATISRRQKGAGGQQVLTVYLERPPGPA